MREICIPDGVEEIGESAFCSCVNLETLILPKNLKIIGEECFAACRHLKNICIPKSVKNIGKHAFYGCIRAESVSILSTDIEIGAGAFGECYNFIYATLPAYALLDIQKTKLTQCIITTGQSICDDAFFNCFRLEKVSISETVKEIGKHAFYGCQNLHSLYLPKSIEKIGDGAFYYCRSLDRISIPYGVDRIGDYTFYGCKNLEHINIPNTVKIIGEQAFFQCKAQSERKNYKGFIVKNGKLKSKNGNKQFFLNHRSYSKEYNLIPENGLLCCENIFDIYDHFSGEYGKDYVICICEASDQREYDYFCKEFTTRWVKPIKTLTNEQAIEIMNGGSEK